MNTIDRDMLIKKYINPDIEKFHNSDVKIVLENLKQNILKMPSADRPQEEWIPCSKRSPKKNDYYLIQITNRDGNGLHMMVAWYQNDHFFTDGIAVAWKPLPEPWEEQKNERLNRAK